MTPKKNRAEPFVRINSRVTKTELQFIKDRAKRERKTEGEMHRLIVEYYMLNKK
jgi:hypothetical protein